MTLNQDHLILAERARFELAVPLLARRFSRPFPSTTRAPLLSVAAMTIITDTVISVESLPGDHRHPDMLGAGIPKRLGCVFHSRAGRHDIIDQ